MKDLDHQILDRKPKKESTWFYWLFLIFALYWIFLVFALGLLAYSIFVYKTTFVHAAVPEYTKIKVGEAWFTPEQFCGQLKV